MIPLIIIVVLSVDRLTKFLAIQNLKPLHSIPVIKGIFHFTLVQNTGAAFGILKGAGIFFVVISIAAIILIGLNLRNAKEKRYIIPLTLILSGATGNLIDRITLGYVVDFLDLRIWPVFNAADSAITIGAIILGWNILFRK